MAAQKLQITQIKSIIGQSPRHRATMETLGLRGINKTVQRDRSDSLDGALRLVAHLVRVEDAAGKE